MLVHAYVCDPSVNPAHMVMAQIVMAYAVMVYIVMGCGSGYERPLTLEIHRHARMHARTHACLSHLYSFGLIDMAYVVMAYMIMA